MLADINPGGRLVEPQEVADAVLKLCSTGFGWRHRPGDSDSGGTLA